MLWRRVSAAFFPARDLDGDGLRLPLPISESRSAFRLVAADPLAGPTRTPARRASDSPMATACFLEREVPVPRFILCISSLTYDLA
jgi:hypothetical protein